MSNSEYLKRNAAPPSWRIDRKIRAYISKPNPGAHPLDRALPIGNVLKQLGVAKVAREIKKAMLANEIIVDGRRVTDPRFAVGLFDTIEIPVMKQAFLISIDLKGRIVINPTKDTKHKPCKITGKHLVPGGKMQLNLIDGRNILVAKDSYKVGDTLVLGIPKQDITKHLKLESGAKALITSGRYVGHTVKVTSVEGSMVKFAVNDTTSETHKEHTYVIP